MVHTILDGVCNWIFSLFPTEASYARAPYFFCFLCTPSTLPIPWIMPGSRRFPVSTRTLGTCELVNLGRGFLSPRDSSAQLSFSRNLPSLPNYCFPRVISRQVSDENLSAAKTDPRLQLCVLPAQHLLGVFGWRPSLSFIRRTETDNHIPASCPAADGHSQLRRCCQSAR